MTAPAPGNAKQPLPQQKGPPPPQLKRQAGPDNRFQRQPSSKTPSAPGNRVTAPAPGNVKPMPPRQKGGVRQATPPATKQGTGRGAPNNFARPHRLEDVKRGRRVTTGPGGARVIEEPGNRVIIRQNNRVVIRQNEITQVRRFTPNAQVQKLPNGINRTVVVRPGGVRVFNEVDGNGRLLRRYRRDGSGREIVLIDNRRFYRNVAIGAGVAALGVGIALALAPPTVAIPRNRYIVDYADASDDDIYDALSAPPVDRLERAYSLEEIRYSEPLRARMRRIDLDTVNFEFGSFEVPPDQYRKLERLARGMLRIIDRNPAEVFLVEGHTDAVGSDDDNLTLSDNRAEAVADILIREFDVPAENIVTQGYGEQFLKVDTDGPEHLNRRVAVRRVTPLLGLADRR
ncbi:MAG: OmpA family protein [Hyphomicrobiaceae bacterium]